MPRRRARVDGNQKSLREAFEKVGGTWQNIAAAHGGEPDAVVGWRGVNRLIEVKDPAASNTDRKLRPKQVAWAERWRGEKPVKVETLAELLALFP